MVEDYFISLDLFYSLDDNLKEDVLSFYLISEIEYNAKYEIDKMSSPTHFNKIDVIYSKKYKMYKYIFEKAKLEIIKYNYLMENSGVKVLMDKMGRYPVVNLGKLILNEKKYGNLKDSNVLNLLDNVANNLVFLKELFLYNENLKNNLAEKIFYSTFLIRCLSVFYDIDYKKVIEVVDCKKNYLRMLIDLDNREMAKAIILINEYVSPNIIYMNMIIENNFEKKDFEEDSLNNIIFFKEIMLKIINNDLLKIEYKKEWLIAIIEEGLSQQAALFSNSNSFEIIKGIEHLFNDIHLELSNFLEIENDEDNVMFNVNLDKLGMVPLTCELRKIYVKNEDLDSQKMYRKTIEALSNIKTIGDKIIKPENNNKTLIEGIYFLNEIGSLNFNLDGQKITVRDIDAVMNLDVKKMVEKAFADVIPNFYINGVIRKGVSINDLLSELAKDLNENIFPGFEKIVMKNDVPLSYNNGVKKVKKF